MNSSDWTLLKVLFEQQNITKASELLYVSQPALSYRIQQLEKEFGVCILTRGKKGIHFTSQGEYLYKYAIDMLDALENVTNHLISMNQKVSGVLKIGATRSLIKSFLPEYLVPFSNNYPDVEFSIKSGHSADIANMILNRDINIGFVRDSVKWEWSKKLVLKEDILIISNKPTTYEELPRLNMVSYSSEASLARVTEQWWRNRYPTPPNILMTVDSLEATKEMVRHGLGFAIVPDANKSGIAGLYTMPLLTKNGESITRESWMIYQDHSLSNNAVSAFIRQICDNLG